MAASSHPDNLGHEPSLGELFGTLTSDLGLLVRKELELAKVEVREEINGTGKAGAAFGGAGFTAYLAAVFVSLAIAIALAAVMPDALAFLLVGVVYAIAAYVLFKQGQERMKQVRPPQQTIETLKEDVEWAKAQMK